MNSDKSNSPPFGVWFRPDTPRGPSTNAKRLMLDRNIYATIHDEVGILPKGSRKPRWTVKLAGDRVARQRFKTEAEAQVCAERLLREQVASATKVLADMPLMTIKENLQRAGRGGITTAEAGVNMQRASEALRLKARSSQ